MTKSNTIAELWTALDRVALANASDQQRKESKRMFYAGASASLHILTDIVASDDVSEDAGVQMIADLHQECEAFSKELIAGRA